MVTRGRSRVRQLELCNRGMFGDLVFTCQMPNYNRLVLPISPVEVSAVRTRAFSDAFINSTANDNEKRRASALLEQLLIDIYSNANVPTSTDYNSGTSSRSQKTLKLEEADLYEKDLAELQFLVGRLQDNVCRIGNVLVRHLKRRDALRRQRDVHCDVVGIHLRKRFPELTDMRFSIEPSPGDSSFAQWHSAMKMVAQLPEGIPAEFRRRLWLALADRHLSSRGVDWDKVEKNCFSEWSHPADSELGVQIVKDLHRTGCSLFCGEDGQENQALLKKVLLAYARWNKDVGYCQGFNMLAALILQVTDKSESDALKLMIYLIEGVLPDSYFADSLRGLSVDMAVFRELLRTRLPRLSKHLDALQLAAKDGTTSYEPPLTNVFTMQWFLTLFCNCLPQPTVLRVWDLILLEGNEILLRTALAIWQALAERILSVRSADEFYCIMGVLTREMLEFGLVDANALIKSVVAIGPMRELKTLRDHYLYNINPWGASMPLKGYRDRDDRNKQLKVYSREKLALDIGVLKKQYVKLKQRQRQAHIIFNAAVARQPQRVAPVAMNHLLLGKSALVPARRIGPPKGAIPPARHQPPPPPTTLHWKDAPRQSSSSSSSDTELCDDPDDCMSADESSSKIGQLPDDNLDKPSDNVLMTSDNIHKRDEPIESASATTNVVTECAETFPENLLDFDSALPETKSPEIDLDIVDVTGPSAPQKDFQSDNQINQSDIFDTASIDSQNLDFSAFGVERRDSIGSEEDSIDFESFLKERISCLKQTVDENDSSDELPEEPERLLLGRKNSERALQIIHENSLILTRILQCQSRFSPSPPLQDMENVEDFELHDIMEMPTSSNIKDRLLGMNLLDTGTDVKQWVCNSVIDEVEEETTPTNNTFSISSIVEKVTPTEQKSSEQTYEGVNSAREETTISSSASPLPENTYIMGVSNQSSPEIKFETMDENLKQFLYDATIVPDDTNTIPQKDETFSQNTNDYDIALMQKTLLDDNISSRDNMLDEVDVFEFGEKPEVSDIKENIHGTIDEGPISAHKHLERTKSIKEKIESMHREASTFLEEYRNKQEPKQEELNDMDDLMSPCSFESGNPGSSELKSLESLTHIDDYQNKSLASAVEINKIPDDNFLLGSQEEIYMAQSEVETVQEMLQIKNDAILETTKSVSDEKLYQPSEAIDSLQSHILEAEKYLEDYRLKKELKRGDSKLIEEPNTNSTELIEKVELIQDNIKAASKYLEDYRNKQELKTDASRDIGSIENLEIFCTKNTSDTAEEGNDSTDTAAGSKYSTILEFSKNLDEKYNNLILNRPSQLFNIENIAINVPLDQRASIISPVENVSPSSIASPLTSPTVNSKEPLRSPSRAAASSPLNSNSSDISNVKYPPLEFLKSPSKSPEQKSPGRESLGESSSLKSPNRIYNPFPVQLSSRQKKDVPIRLGLYKK